MYDLTITAETAEELRDKVTSLASTFGLDSAEAEKPKTATKKTETKAAAKKADPEPEKEPEKSEPEVEHKTIEDVRAAMASIIQALGDDGPAEATDLLDKHGAKKASDLDGDEHGEARDKYVEAAEALVKKHSK